MRAFKVFVTALLAGSQVQAKAVFAHFMVGNTAQYTTADFVYDMQLAQQAHIDGFALNIAYNEEANAESIPMAFNAAAQVSGFKLFFSFDYAGKGPWPKKNVTDLINTYSGHGSYFRHSTGQPLVSTFEGPGSADDWVEIKGSTKCFFIPSWSSLGARKAILKSNHVVDGLFNWGAWPDGVQRTNWELDASYLTFLNNSGPYMAPVSPWFFTNMPGYDKNWLWRGDELWFDRWQQLWGLSIAAKEQWPGEPEYLQIISWNDYGESHYIGPLNDKAYVAFGKEYGNAPFNYALGMPHDGWRQLLPFMIEMWKTGNAVITQEALVGWYRLAPSHACGTGGTVGNNAAQEQQEMLPSVLMQDKVFFAALTTKVLFPRVTIGGSTRVIAWDSGPDPSLGGAGIYYGSADFNGNTGDVLIELLDGTTAVATLKGKAISSTCANSVQNWNAWVGSAPGRSMTGSPVLPLDKQKCIEGGGSSDDYADLCEFTCRYGYCPPGPCTCYRMGTGNPEPDIEGVEGYPKPGSDCTYKGLCSYACNHDFCPSDFCTLDSAAKDKCVIPAPEPDDPENPDDPDEGCTSGTGEGNLSGLCDYSCGRGFCPLGACKCLSYGSPITPPPATDKPGYPALGLGIEYKALCDFTCSRGYCPPGACTHTNPYGQILVEEPSCNKADENSVWSCSTLDCSVADDLTKTAKVRWEAVGTNEFIDYTIGWFGDYNDFNPNPATGAQPFSGTPFEDNPVDAVAYFFSGKNDKGGSLASELDCGTTQTGGACSDPNDFKCGKTQHPALDLYLTSCVNIHVFYNTMYDSLDSVATDLALSIQEVTDTFYPEPDDNSDIFLGILDGFSTILSFAGLGVWSKAATGAIEASTTAIDAFSTGFGAIADKQKEDAEKAVEDAAKTIASQTREFIKQARTVIQSYLKGLFTGGYTNYQTLGKQLKDGVFLVKPNSDSFAFFTALTPVVNAMAITSAWKLAGVQNTLAVIYEPGNKDKIPNDLGVDGSDSDTRVRVPDADYTLWLVVGGECKDKSDNGCYGTAATPTGIDELGTDTRWEISRDDIALSAFYGYMRAGKTNSYLFNSKGSGVDPEKFAQLPFGDGLRTPGLFKLPVCDSNLYDLNMKFAQSENKKFCDYHPCCEEDLLPEHS